MSSRYLKKQISNTNNNSTLSRLNRIHGISSFTSGKSKFQYNRKHRPSLPTLQQDRLRTVSSDVRRSFSMREEITQLKRHETPMELLQRIIKLVRVLCRVCIAMRRYAVSKSDSRAMLDIQSLFKQVNVNLHDMQTEDKGINFNKFLYSVESKHTFPLWARKLCSQPPDEREPEQIDKLCRFLRGIATFSHFTSEAQVEICRHVTYDRYDKMRLILNQGDYAEYYYILISGKVLINLSRKDRNTGIEITETIDHLREHQAFGATALIYNTRRSATVVSETFVEVLMIDSDTFANFCADQLAIQFEKEKTFLETHDVFRNWSKRRLQRIFYDVKTKFYRSGKIIDFDIMNSKYVYFVMEGAIDIFYSHREDKRRWLYSRKLNRNVGVLGGNRICTPDACNLVSLLDSKQTQQNVRCLIISHGATVLYIPKIRFREIAPKDFLTTYKAIPSFRNLTDAAYKYESVKAVKWLEYRTQIAKKRCSFEQINVL